MQIYMCLCNYDHCYTPPRWPFWAPPLQEHRIMVLDLLYCRVFIIMNTWSRWSMLLCRRSPEVCVVMAGLTCCTLISWGTTVVQPHPAPESNQSDSGQGGLLKPAIINTHSTMCICFVIVFVCVCVFACVCLFFFMTMLGHTWPKSAPLPS